MIKFVSYTNVNPTVEPASNVQGFEFRKIIRQPEDDVLVETLPEDALAEVLPEVITRPTTRRSSIDTSSLLSTDIEDIFRQAGLTTINGKKIKFGNKALRAQNASFGARNSNHKKRDPYTGNAMARDISIIGGNLDDYAEFRRQIMSNALISKYMDTKGWGIINEVTPQILARTGGTGPHFHFGPDTWARRTWQAWRNNPNAPITQAFKQGGRFTFKRNQIVKNAEQLNGKKDMRKKLVKSDVVTNKKKRVKKGQEGLKFATYTPIETPIYKPDEISNPFSEYNFPTQYKEVYVERPQEQEVIIEAEPVKQETSKQQKVSAPKVTTQFGSRKDFVNTLYSHLYKALQENGIDAKTWAPILTAHTSIESGWGNEFSRKNNNFGGIKGKGSGMVKTREYSPERGYYTINDSFKSYASIDDFANDYVKILKNMGAFNGTPDQYLANLKKHRYFTARLEDYQKMFNSILRTVNSLLSS